MVFGRIIARARKVFAPQALNIEQSVLDSHRTVLLLKCYEWYRAANSDAKLENGDNTATQQPTQADVDVFYKEAEDLTVDHWPAFNQEQLNVQMEALFRNMKDCWRNNEEDNSSYSSSSSSNSSSDGNNVVPFDMQALIEKVGFGLERRQSSVCSGEGVFVSLPKGHDVRNQMHCTADLGLACLSSPIRGCLTIETHPWL
jgi:hypothetical protein